MKRTNAPEEEIELKKLKSEFNPSLDTALPDEMVVEIVKMLPIPSVLQLLRTCKRMLVIIDDPYVWKYFWLSIIGSEIPSQMTTSHMKDAIISTVSERCIGCHLSYAKRSTILHSFLCDYCQKKHPQYQLVPSSTVPSLFCLKPIHLKDLPVETRSRGKYYWIKDLIAKAVEVFGSTNEFVAAKKKRKERSAKVSATKKRNLEAKWEKIAMLDEAMKGLGLPAALYNQKYTWICQHPVWDVNEATAHFYKKYILDQSTVDWLYMKVRFPEETQVVEDWAIADYYKAHKDVFPVELLPFMIVSETVAQACLAETQEEPDSIEPLQ